MFSVHYCFFFFFMKKYRYFCFVTERVRHMQKLTMQLNDHLEINLFVATQNYYFYSIELNQRLTKLARAKTFYRG